MDINAVRARRSSARSWPTIAFPARGVLEGTLGVVHAMSADRQAGQPWTVLLYAGGKLPANALCIFTPTPLDETKLADQAKLEQEALLDTASCCIVVKRVEQLTVNTSLRASDRKKVKLLVFLGEESEPTVKAIDILFPGLRASGGVLFGSQANDSAALADRIIELAETI